MVLSSYQPTPEEGQAAPAGKYRLFVAAANTNEVYVVSIGDNKTMNLAETIHVAPAPLSPLGMTPSALALSADQKHLYVACSDADVVASVDVSAMRGVVEGFLPAGAYPAALRVSGDRVWVANARGNTVEALGDAFRAIADPPEPEIAPAEHVIYVIRDNQPEASDARDRRDRAGFHRETRPAAHFQHRRPGQLAARGISLDQRPRRWAYRRQLRGFRAQRASHRSRGQVVHEAGRFYSRCGFERRNAAIDHRADRERRRARGA